VQATMTADTSQRLPSAGFNGDMGYLRACNQRDMKRVVVGAEGKFNLISTD